jgi:eukaryotic-like serine/threonine-protein kinase
VSGTRRWDHVKALFHQALERAPADRAMFLRQACAGDREMEADVESLLAADEQAGSFADGSPLGALDDSAIASLARVLEPGDRLGPSRSWRRSAPAGWARSTRRATRG